MIYRRIMQLEVINVTVNNGNKFAAQVYGVKIFNSAPSVVDTTHSLQICNITLSKET